MTKPIIDVADAPRVPPGKAAFPLHHHHASKERFFILSGSGVLRVGEATYPVKPQDYIVNLPGGADTAHQLVNTGTENLVYLAISTQLLPEVAGYPESGKTGVRLGMGEAADARYLLRDTDKDAIGYWDGEEGRGVETILAKARTGE